MNKRNFLAMAEEEIKRIAEEFTKAKMIADGLDPNNKHNKNLYEMDVEDSIVRFRWLSKDYCIVPKSAMEELDIINRIKDHNLIILDKEDVEKLFGKNLFEQKGE